jgi:hypothetical protein
MAGSDKEQFRRAMQGWEHLHAEKAYSVPPRLGRVAILCSFITNVHTKEPDGLQPNDHDQEIHAFKQESYALADWLLSQHRRPEVILNVDAGDIDDVLREPRFSDVITVGHGSLCGFYAHNTDDGNYVSWQAVACSADHLKQGLFIQRHCGGIARNLSVPYGAFAVTDHRNVLAAIGSDFQPTDLNHPDNDLLRPVSPVRALTYDYIRAHYSSGSRQAVGT